MIEFLIKNSELIGGVIIIIFVWFIVKFFDSWVNTKYEAIAHFILIVVYVIGSFEIGASIMKWILK